MSESPSKPGPELAASPATAIRALVVPATAPPYDDDPDRPLWERNGAVITGSAVPPPGPGGDGLRPADVARAHGGLLPQSSSGPGPAADGRRPADLARGYEAPQPRASSSPGRTRWPSQFAQILAETLAGSRPSRQLTAWTTEETRRQIRQLGPRLATGERPLVHRVMTSAPASGVLEVTAVVGFGPRVRVLALRLEREQAGRGWCCTAIESA